MGDHIAALVHAPRRWRVPGAAGLTCSNLVERLPALGQAVVGLDNLATAHTKVVLETAMPAQRRRLRFLEGDIRHSKTCRAAFAGCDLVMYQAARGPVPPHDDPVAPDADNVSVNVLVTARDAPPPRPMATIPTCPRSRTGSGGRFRPMPSRTTQKCFTAASASAPTSWPW
jgi:hypothetical protein